jgi:membrane-associated phospholipid phosphatase
MEELRQIQSPGSPCIGVPTLSRFRKLALNWVVFSLCYPLANHLAQQAQVRRSFALAADAAVPFLPWMIVPYASLSLVFTLVFFLVRTCEELRIVSRRLLLATVAGSLVFALAPARFSLARPIPTEALPATLFRWLDLIDQPYNQMPSLHVAYSVILWLALHPLYRGGARVALGIWLALVSAGTVLTWQHHLIDVAAGMVLAVASALLVLPGHTSRETISFHYAIAAGILLLVGVFTLHSWLLAYAAVSLILVALTYHLRRPDFLLKRAGRHSLSAWLLYWPYLAGYWLTWVLVLLRERKRPAFTQHAPGLWIGRRLTQAEAQQLPTDCHVIDLCGELPENALLRGQRYRCIPLLDLQAPSASRLRSVLAAIEQHRCVGEPVYVHCAMGYSRSRLIARIAARIYIRKHQSCRSPSIS